MSIDDYDTNNQDSQILNGDSVENHQREVDQQGHHFFIISDMVCIIVFSMLQYIDNSTIDYLMSWPRGTHKGPAHKGPWGSWHRGRATGPEPKPKYES